MDFKERDDLLQKYWNCETSLEEEKLLREYFGNGEIPEQLKDTASVFRYFEEAKKNRSTMRLSTARSCVRLIRVKGK